MTNNAPRFRVPLGAAVLALSVLGAGCGSGDDPAPKNATPQAATSRSAPPSQAAPSQAEVTGKLRRLEKERGVRIGAYAVDTGSGRFLAYRGGERFPFASTFKAMACGAVLRKARDSDPGLLSRVIHYKKSDVLPNSPVTEKNVDKGMSVADLCHAAITKSDNTAGNLTLKEIGGPAGLTRFLRSLGDEVSRSDRWEPGLNEWKPGEKRDTTAARPWGADLRALTVGDALAPADRTTFIGWLKDTATGGARIRAGLPKGWTSGDKTGTGGVYGNANDIAIVWPPSGAPLVMSVLTTRKGADAEMDEKAIARTAAVLARGLRPA